MTTNDNVSRTRVFLRIGWIVVKYFRRCICAFVRIFIRLKLFVKPSITQYRPGNRFVNCQYLLYLTCTSIMNVLHNARVRILSVQNNFDSHNGILLRGVYAQRSPLTLDILRARVPVNIYYIIAQKYCNANAILANIIFRTVEQINSIRVTP